VRSFIDDPRLPDDVTIADLRDLAERLARGAGARVRAGRPDRVEVAATKSNDVDVVTQADADTEGWLRRELAAARPDDAVLGEEEGATTGSSGITWVLDPIDGTVNYLYGVPHYAVSVAAVVGTPDPGEWTILAGAVHSVADERTWSAGLGTGATLDGRELRVGEPVSLGQCLVGTGFGYDPDRRRAQAGVLVEVLPRVRDIRRLGSAAIDLCLVASGELDLYYERGLNPWDMAAGALVAQEAGARLTGLRGRPADREMVVAGAPARAAELVRVLEDAAADTGA